MMKVGNQSGCFSQTRSVLSHHSCGPKIGERVTESVHCWRQRGRYISNMEKPLMVWIDDQTYRHVTAKNNSGRQCYTA